MIKVLIVNAYSDIGGASRAARRLEESLRDVIGIQVDYLSIYDGDQAFYTGASKFIRAASNRLPGYLLGGKDAFFSTPFISSTKLINYINRSDYDLINLHWVNSGSLSISDIGKIRKKVLWTLHDMWPVTGGCHYSSSCRRFEENCSIECRELGFGSIRSSLSSYFYNLKMHNYSSIPFLGFIGLSRWIALQASLSSLSNGRPVYNLPNPINTDLFKPSDKYFSKRHFGFDADKKIILFGAAALSEKRKGFQELLSAISYINFDCCQLVVLGKSDNSYLSGLGLPITNVGFVNSDKQLASLYSAADVVVVPSLEENLSNMIMESLSCGVPVVAFDIGGNSDMIDHSINGYLAKEKDPIDLANGIDYVLNNRSYGDLSQNARNKVLKSFSYSVVSSKYVSLFKDIVRLF